MSDADFNARLARIAQSRAPQPAPVTAGPAPQPKGAPRPGSYRARLQKALFLAQQAGISQTMCWPPLMRALSGLGLPVRPLHYKSMLSLFVTGGLMGFAIFGGVLWLASAPDVGTPTRGPIAGLVRLGWPGVYGMSVAIGALLAIVTKAQAVSARLPRWRDL